MIQSIKYKVLFDSMPKVPSEVPSAGRVVGFVTYINNERDERYGPANTYKCYCKRHSHVD